MTWFKQIALLAALACLSACATFDARLNTAVNVHTAVVQGATSALNASLISSQDALAFQGIATNSRVMMDSARILKDSDIETAEGKLKLANDILNEIQRYLQSKLEGDAP